MFSRKLTLPFAALVAFAVLAAAAALPRPAVAKGAAKGAQGAACDVLKDHIKNKFACCKENPHNACKGQENAYESAGCGEAAQLCSCVGVNCDDGNPNTMDYCEYGDCHHAPFSPGFFQWEMSKNGGRTWSPVTLPDTGWGCSNCQRLYRTTIMGKPSALALKFASDNQARMFVNGTVVFGEYYWSQSLWCTAAPCCSQCGDTHANCYRVVANQTPFYLDAGDLANFTDGANVIQWQVNEEYGGDGFHTQMMLAY
ncbi:MAG: hypothetical protein ABII00_01485 [Elusimicrobiota bacterium]